MRSFQQLNTNTTNQALVQPQKPAIQAKQKPIQSKQGKNAPHKAKQQPLQRNKKGATGQSSSLGEYQIKENVSQLTGTDITDAKVHYNSSKPAQLQAEATAQGTEVHLAPGKEQHLGHELTHVAQQKQGRVQPTVQANNGVGINNDPMLEKEADDIGDQASKGAVSSSKEISSSSLSNNSAAPVQRYVVYSKQEQFKRMSEADSKIVNPTGTYTEKDQEKYQKQTEDFEERYKKDAEDNQISTRNQRLKEGWRHPQRKNLFVSNDGKMAVEGQGTNSAQAWAESSLIDKANQVLKAKGSYVELVAKTNDLIVGSVPGQTAANPHKGSFKKVVAVKSGTQDSMSEKANTTERAYGIYNATTATSAGDSSLATIKLRDCGNANRLIMGCVQADGSFTNRVYKSKDGTITLETANPNDTIQAYIQKVMQAEHPAVTDYADKAKAYKAYQNLGSTEKAAIDEKYGLNASARPTLGQGVTMVGSQYDNTQTGYNYHFATNIMQSDDKGDYMALEGLADHEVWYFSMYGTQKGESFDERQVNVVQRPHISTIVDK
ncbi:MAG TPA: hypothetical protein DCS93_03205 [Microscillaceae bacterium]|nr:hypothetical protein [Microscillaceae bacterium]